MAFEALPLTVIGIIILIAIGLSVLAKRLGFNPVVGYILAGFILGPFFLGYLHPQDALVMGFGELGLFILLFYLGLELSLASFLKSGVSSIGLALIDMAITGGIGFAIMALLGFSPLFSIIIGFMLFSGSTAIVGKFVIDKGLIKEPPAQHAISMLILQDFLGILLLVFITSMSTTGSSSAGLAFTALVFAVTTFFAVHYLSQKVGKWLIRNGYGHTEITIYALGVGFVVSTIGVFLGLTVAIGAYFAGFALAETPSGEKIKRDVNFMRDFFLVFFFVAFGTTIFYNASAGAISLPELPALLTLGGMALLLVVSAFAAHLLAVSVFGPRFRIPRTDAGTIAILLLPLGEFVVIIASVSSKILSGAESAYVSVLGFLLIAISLIMFQPLYNASGTVRRLAMLIPEPFRLKKPASIKPHTPYTLSLIKKASLNAFVVLCFAWMTILLYEELPRFGVPILFSREITAFIIFAFFAAVPFRNALKALKRLALVGMREVEQGIEVMEHRKHGKFAHGQK